MAEKLQKQEFVTGVLKEELIEAIGDKVRVTNDLSNDILGAVANAYIRAITEYQADVGFGKVGTFKTKVREARTGRNPQTGEDMEIPEQLTTRLSLGKAFKDALKNAEI